MGASKHVQHLRRVSVFSPSDVRASISDVTLVNVQTRHVHIKTDKAVTTETTERGFNVNANA